MTLFKHHETNIDRFLLSGGVTITPNLRTAQDLRTRAKMYKPSDIKSNSYAQKIMSLSEWVLMHFKDLQLNNISPFNRLSIINDANHISYWVRAIYTDNKLESFANPEELINEAISADKIMTKWMIDDFIPDSFVSERFMAWKMKVRSDMNRVGCITEYEALSQVIEAVKNGKLRLPSKVAVYAFDEVPPLYQKLFKTIAQQSELIQLNPPTNTADWKKVKTQSDEEQIQLSAQWASKIIKNNTNASIAIICPDLREKRSKILKQFNKVFEPQSLLLKKENYTAPYNFSLGEQLDSVPLISRALHYLSTAENRMTPMEIQHVLNDPFICSDSSEMKARRRFAFKMRDSRTYRKSLLDIAMSAYCPSELKKKLSGFTKAINTGKVFITPSKWVQVFNNSLELLGWGEGLIVSEETKNALSQWNTALDELAAMDLHCNEISRDVVLCLLKNLCSYTYTKNQTVTSPISILGTLEAAGLNFDYMWVLDCNNNVFPPAAKLNSCLPQQLQIEGKTPHSSGEREYEFNQKLFTRYLGSCSKLISSYLCQNEYGEMKPAPIIEDIAEAANLSDILDIATIDYRYLNFKKYQVFEEEEIISELVPKNNKLNAGAVIIDNMAACPMRAIFENRVKIRAVPKSLCGSLSNIEKSSLRKSALEGVWKQLISYRNEEGFETDHAALCSLSDDALMGLIKDIVLECWVWVDREDISITAKESERELVSQSMFKLLKLEQKRAPFNVQSITEEQTITIDGLDIKVKIDRVDDVLFENGKKSLALNYKNSEHSVSELFSKNIKSQLALGLAMTDYDGVAYACSSKDTPKINGIGKDIADVVNSEEHKFRNVPKGLDRIKLDINEKASELIARFTAGESTYTPSPESCRFCAVKNTCQYSV